MKPVVLPMLHLLQLQSNVSWRELSWDVLLPTTTHSQDTLELMREHLNKASLHLMPIIKYGFGAAAPCQFKMPHEKLLDDLYIVTIHYRLKINGSQVAALFRE